jgi:hypothetical protein
MTRTARILAFLLCSTFGIAAARAEQVRVIDAERMLLKDVALSVPESLASFDLGPAPPPGSSRLVSRVEVERSLRGAGQSLDGVTLSASLRVVAASRSYDREQLIRWLAPAVTEKLPLGVSLRSLSPASRLVTSPSASVGGVLLPKLPKRPGTVRTTAIVELCREGAIVGRLSVGLVLDVSEQAARPAVERGATVQLIIAAGGVEVATPGIAMQASELGELGSFRVVKTNKVLLARLESPHAARVESR